MFRSVGGWKKMQRYPLVRDRFDVICTYIENRTVLDCGSGGEEIKPDEAWWQELFLHKKIKEVAREVVGIDTDRDAIERLRDMGYDIIYGDVETMDLGRQFEVIVAGEFIEHLSNPGLFLERAKEHLQADGRLILTTPNAWALGNLLRGFFGRRIEINKGHVAWYDEVMLRQLLERHGFEIEKFFWHQRVMRSAYRLVCFLPHWALNVIIVAKKKNASDEYTVSGA